LRHRAVPKNRVNTMSTFKNCDPVRKKLYPTVNTPSVVA
jgi:hypothetical protein